MPTVDGVLTYPVRSLVGGINVKKDLTQIADNESPWCKNVVFVEGNLQKRKGYVTFGSGLPLDGQVMAIKNFVKYDGTSYLFAITTKSIYYYNATTQAWVLCTSGQDIFSGTADDTVVADVVGDTFIFTNGAAELKKTTATTISALDTDSIVTTARFVINFLGWCHLLDTTESAVRSPQRVRYNDGPANVEDWTGGTSGITDLGGSSDYVVCGAVVGQRLFLLKERSIAVCDYYSADAPFGFTENVLNNIGTKSPLVLFPYGDSIFYLAYSKESGFVGPCLYNGSTNTRVAVNQLSLMLSRTDPSKLRRAFSVWSAENRQIRLNVMNTTGTWDTWIWDVDENVWVLADYQFTAAGYYTVASTFTWLDLVGTWSEQTWKWNDSLLTGSKPLLLFGDANGYVYEDRGTDLSDNGTAISAEFRTKGFVLVNKDNAPIPNFKKRCIGLELEAKGTSVVVEVSVDEGRTWRQACTVTLSEDFNFYTVPFDVVGRVVQFRFTNATTTGYFVIRSFNILYTVQGRR